MQVVLSHIQMPTSITKIIIFFCRHVYWCTCLWSDKNEDKDNTVLEIGEIERVSKAEDLELFGMLAERDLFFLDRLVTAFADLVVEAFGNTDLWGFLMDFGFVPDFWDLLERFGHTTTIKFY